ncbi:PQQ-dependent sugar dehydrogenase [Zobellia uliginosa]|uniref:PQQ-dependent sugar dehydrogenase n=1 Tax=Zobellia uliginosa TaxID=143224 RepID=UPI0026E3BE10|nr:PQQ-dependent sugar dehydrogenase [Zobellia uliginosa]MDO6518317.1 PQQ-dependent sugar dehydrogenase [Zobellia uliginosa]
MRNSVLSITLAAITLSYSCAQSTENKVDTPTNTPYSAELMIDELQTPWGFVFLGENELLITEKSGELIHYKDGNKTKIKNVPEVYARGQGGLLDIELHPDFKNNGWIYISYASQEGEGKGGHTALMRCKLNDNSLSHKELLYKASPNTTKGQHFGSRIEFDNDGYLYLSIGERGARDENPQDITRDGGKIYRFYDDGRIPEDNPFTGKKNAKTAIYSYGHRNPQGLAIHPETGEIWENEHGPRGGDEINIIKAGANYGWPLVTYGINYSGTSITDKTEMEGMTQPIHYWVPSIAPSGMAFVTTDTYKGWKGSILVGSLKFQYMERLQTEGNKVVKREKLLSDLGRVRDIKEGPDGLIYVAVEGKGIYKLVPSP